MVNLLSSRSLLLALSACAALPSFVHARVVRHKFTLTWEVGAPNGIAREMIKINGKFPVPTIFADEGDDVEVRISTFSCINLYMHVAKIMI